MDIDDSPEEAAYRQTVRAYLELSVAHRSGRFARGRNAGAP